MNYNLEWDPAKAKTNQHKHGVSFERAATVFHDPNQISIFDEQHSEDEDRWITLGMDELGSLLVVIHTFRATDADAGGIRIISARKATRNEIRQYQEYTR